jgi:hypothetical protein
VVYVLLRHAWPPAHDLSDIRTGLMRDGVAFIAGIIGAVVANISSVDVDDTPTPDKPSGAEPNSSVTPGPLRVDMAL